LKTETGEHLKPRSQYADEAVQLAIAGKWEEATKLNRLIIDTFGPDVILTDVRMPKMGGLDLLATLKAKAAALGLTLQAWLQKLAGEEPKSVQPDKPFNSGYGMLAKYGPAPSAEEIDENRREMFGGFGYRELQLVRPHRGRLVGPCIDQVEGISREAGAGEADRRDRLVDSRFQLTRKRLRLSAHSHVSSSVPPAASPGEAGNRGPAERARIVAEVGRVQASPCIHRNADAGDPASQVAQSPPFLPPVFDCTGRLQARA